MFNPLPRTGGLTKLSAEIPVSTVWPEASAAFCASMAFRISGSDESGCAFAQRQIVNLEIGKWIVDLHLILPGHIDSSFSRHETPIG